VENKTICVIDDDPAIRQSIHALVRSIGWQASTYASAEAFLSVGDFSKGDCVVCDIRMADISGLELLTKLRSAGHTIPFILLSAAPSIRNRADASRNRAFCLLEKPVDPDALIESMRQSISENHPVPS
jgi:FixJ family two-component response regulator